MYNSFSASNNIGIQKYTKVTNGVFILSIKGNAKIRQNESKEVNFKRVNKQLLKAVIPYARGSQTLWEFTSLPFPRPLKEMQQGSSDWRHTYNSLIPDLLDLLFVPWSYIRLKIKKML